MENKCDLCGLECKTAQGLAAHKRFRHPDANPAPEPIDNSTYTKEEIDEDFRKVISVFGEAFRVTKECFGEVDALIELARALRVSVQELKANDLTLNWRMTELERRAALPAPQRRYQ